MNNIFKVIPCRNYADMYKYLGEISSVYILEFQHSNDQIDFIEN